MPGDAVDNASFHSHKSLLSKPINNTRLRRVATLASIKILKHFRRRMGPVLVLSPKLCVKFGSHRDLAEARTMQFIAEHTSIPVPKVYCSFVHKGTTYIVMEKIDGEMATLLWSSLSEESRNRVLLQLKGMLNEMRALVPPNESIASVDGGSLWDDRLPTNLERFGPFDNVQEFHSFLRDGLEKGPPDCPEVDEMISLQKSSWGRPVFTHGDLSSLNILVRKNQVVGIVDWETAGWYPSYWEYTSAHQVNIRNIQTSWYDYVDRFLDPVPDALRMESVRQRWWSAT